MTAPNVEASRRAARFPVAHFLCTIAAIRSDIDNRVCAEAGRKVGTVTPEEACATADVPSPTTGPISR